MDLASLPLDLLPTILSHVQRRHDLYRSCLVSREWNAIATPLLYSHVRLFGRDLVSVYTLPYAADPLLMPPTNARQAVVPSLFRELSRAPHLCRLLRKLEVRVYPLSLILSERLETESQAVAILRQAVNLRELIWTRKGSITDRVLEAIVSLPNLESFEFNAHTSLSPGSWSPEILLLLPRLRSLSLILPDRSIAAHLPSILARQADLAESTGLGLLHFTILSRESVAINDRVIQACAPYLGSLQSLAIAGCTRVTGEPLVRLLPTLPHLRHLALEATSIPPSFFPDATKYLRNLVSLVVTHPGPRSVHLSNFFPSLTALLLETPNLRSFTVYHSGVTEHNGVREWPLIRSTEVSDLVQAVGGQLRKLEISGILLAPSSAELIAMGFPKLRDLVVHLGYLAYDASRLGEAFSNLKHLRTLHVQWQRTDVTIEDAQVIANQCSPTLRQIGIRNQVWIITREWINVISVPTSLSSYKARDGTILLRETAEAFGAFKRSRFDTEQEQEQEQEQDDED